MLGKIKSLCTPAMVYFFIKSFYFTHIGWI